jgi:hypothetical protein
LRPSLHAPVPFEIRPLEPMDVPALLGQTVPAHDAPKQALRRYWIENGLQGCHVAVVKDGPICFMQWLFSARDNDQIRHFFGDELPQLAADTVMVEGAYTPPAYRRLPIMPAAMERLAMRGREIGARWAVVYISDGNPAMIKAAQWAGFAPFEEKWFRRRFFRTIVSFEPLPSTRQCDNGSVEGCSLLRAS